MLAEGKLSAFALYGLRNLPQSEDSSDNLNFPFVVVPIPIWYSGLWN
jgi:hypothetical protein